MLQIRLSILVVGSRTLLYYHFTVVRLVSGHALVLARHLKALVDQSAKRREMSFVELAQIETAHLTAERVRIVLPRRQAEHYVQEGRYRTPRFEQTEKRCV